MAIYEWAKRHLDWVFGIAYSVTAFTAIFVMVEVTLDVIIVPIGLIILLLCVLSQLGVGIWYLYQKKRSFAWMLFFISVGGIFLLCLANKRCVFR